ncbi:MAG: hypothetical protein IID09_00025 [Candidatus Hydrogenedentes bacterium]|nr:hypothetical protein [Candidatus Hydrogenedentota bacterium]
MKSAYEIAMEKLDAASGPVKTLSDEQKEQVAEIDKSCDAKIAETKLTFDEKLAAAPPEKVEELQQELASELARLEEKRETEKESFWNETQG